MRSVHTDDGCARECRRARRLVLYTHTRASSHLSSSRSRKKASKKKASPTLTDFKPTRRINVGLGRSVHNESEQLL